MAVAENAAEVKAEEFTDSVEVKEEVVEVEPKELLPKPKRRRKAAVKVEVPENTPAGGLMERS